MLLADLLQLMRRLGASDGVVRTAVSRLAKDGVLQGRRAGRQSAYALTPAADAEFREAVPLIYGSGGPAWDGRLHLAFPEPGADRSGLEAAGYALLAPGVLVSPSPAPGSVLGSVPGLGASGPASAMRQLAARAWPLARLAEAFTTYADLMRPLWPVPGARSLGRHGDPNRGDPCLAPDRVARPAAAGRTAAGRLARPRGPAAMHRHLRRGRSGIRSVAGCRFGRRNRPAARSGPARPLRAGTANDNALSRGRGRALPDVSPTSGGGKRPSAPAWSRAPTGSRFRRRSARR